ncbi:sphingomyelin phosphodiesterase [Aquimarina longa]|uniref:sphingomyelin phosphodiesterase n=1 Tax=Aquimarina longa TaxID=1080221 RepID=UPI0007815A0F|nr:sphingomyelin phosphodiesterase [Aquimarina longa]
MKNVYTFLIFIISALIVSCSEEENNLDTDINSKQYQLQTNKNKESLTVLSYNVFHLPGIASIKHYKEVERSKGQYQILKDMVSSIDVIVFQEGFNNQVNTHLFNKLSNLYPYSTILVGKYCNSGSYWNSVAGNCSNSILVVNGGVRIFSKYPIVAKHQYVFNASAYGTADYYSNKGAVYVEINKNNKNYHIVGTHLQADQGSYEGTSVRLDQLKEIKNWVTGFKIPISEPLIYAGDMNVEYTNIEAYTSMKRILNSKIAYYFDSSVDIGTYSNTNTLVKEEYPDYNNTLDYILIDKGHKQPISIPEMQVLQFKKKGEDLSDHHPVKTTYYFSK